MSEHSWQVVCDRSGEDGVTCMSFGSTESAMHAEAAARVNGWTGGDGWHECPRHLRESHAVGVPR